MKNVIKFEIAHEYSKQKQKKYMYKNKIAQLQMSINSKNNTMECDPISLSNIKINICLKLSKKNNKIKINMPSWHITKIAS